MRELLIVDPTLKSYEGHSWNYDRAVFAAAWSRFDAVKLFADVRFSADVVDIPVFPAFNRIDLDALKSCANRVFSAVRPRSTGGIIGEAHATIAPGTPSTLVNLAKRLRAWDFSHGLERAVAMADPDAEHHLFVQHAFISELLAAERWLRAGRRAHFHVVLRYAPELVNVGFLADSDFAAMLARLADPDHGNTSLYTDSERLSQRYRDLSGRRVTTLPIPVPEAFRIAEGAPPSEDIVTLGFLGSSRVDKGFDQLPEIIGSLPARIHGRAAKALVQVTRSSADPRIRAAISRLQSLGAMAPAVEILDSPVPAETYYGWFSRATMVVLPYVARKYEASTSGILVEAILGGVPVVVRGNSWMGDQVVEARERYGLAVGEVFTNRQGLVDAVARVARDSGAYRAHVRRYRASFRAFHNPERLVRILGGEGR
jgi:glycosyltransferase involved in cell wall biosynthesis